MFKFIWRNKILFISFLLPLYIYSKTLLPTVGFWDTGEFQTVPYTFDIAHPTGYPTYILFGNLYLKIFNLGTVAWRMNFLSALYASLAIYLLSILIKQITNNNYLSIFIPILISINPYLWFVANRADPHSLHVLFAALFMLLLYNTINTKDIKKLYMFCLITGISLGNHMLSVFFLLPLSLSVLLFIKFDKKYLKIIFLSVIFFAIGTSVYLLLPIISSVKEPISFDYKINSITSFKRHVIGEDFIPTMNSWAKGDFKSTIQYYIDLVKNSFPYYSYILIIFGATISFFQKKNRSFYYLIFFIYISTLYFSLRYQNGILERYFLTSYVISGVWIAVCFQQIIKVSKISIIKYIIYLCLLYIIAVQLPINYRASDESKNTYSYDWAYQTLSNLPKNSQLFSWWSYSTPLWYIQRVENLRPDILVTNLGSNQWESNGIKAIETRNVYYIENFEINNNNYSLEQNGNLYKLIKKY